MDLSFLEANLSSAATSVGLCAVRAMPKQAAHLRRGGEHARGGARINASSELPNTSSAAWAENFRGKTTTFDAMGDEEDENSSPNKRPYAAVAGELKRPLKARDGVGQGRGKTPKTIIRREKKLADELRREQQQIAYYQELADAMTVKLADPEEHIVKQAVLLRYGEIAMYMRYQGGGSSSGGGVGAADDEEEEELHDDDDEEKAVRRDLEKSVVHVLSQMSDFKSEKCKLVHAVEEMGGQVILLPKYHACCNAIEYVWGNRKKAFRKTCDMKMDTLRVTGYLTMARVDPTFVQKAFRKARNFMTALRDGGDVFDMFKKVACIKKDRYVSHRRPAPSQYE